MKRSLLLLAVIGLASPAWALTVTNLDHVPHTVELVGGGASRTQVIAPDATEYFTGAAHGVLSLVTAQKVKKSRSTLNSDGLLSGVIGAGRNQQIPVDPNDSYVIWPGGDLRLQGHRKMSTYR